jgi:hypothetical protein
MGFVTALPNLNEEKINNVLEPTDQNWMKDLARTTSNYATIVVNRIARCRMQSIDTAETLRAEMFWFLSSLLMMWGLRWGKLQVFEYPKKRLGTHMLDRAVQLWQCVT